MYDQVRFLLRQRMPGGGMRQAPHGAGASNVAQHGFRRASIFPMTSAARCSGRTTGEERSRIVPRHVQPVLPQRTNSRKSSPRKARISNTRSTSISGRRSRARRRGLRSRATKSAQRVTAPVREPAASVTCPQCDGTGHVTQMAGAMKFSLTCPRCEGTGRLRNACPTCHGDGRVAHKETVEVRIPPGAQSGSRLRVAGKGNAGRMGAPAGRSVHHHARGAASVFPPRRRQHRDPGSGHGDRSESGSEDRSSDHRWADSAESSAGTSNGQKFRLREKGVMNTRSNPRGDQIVEVVDAGAESRRTSARANCCGNWRSCTRKIRGKSCGRQV